MIFTSMFGFFYALIVNIQVLYLKKIEPTSRLAKLGGYFGEQSVEIKKGSSLEIKLIG